MQPTLLALNIWLSVVLLGIAWVVFRRERLSPRVMVWTALIVVVSMAGYTAWVAADFFRAWNANPHCSFCQLHLPPYSNYWYEQSFWLYGKYFGLNALVGLVFGAVFWWFARRTGGQVIDRDDVFLLTLAGVMIGWPNILLFLAGLFLTGITVYLLKRHFHSRVTNARVIITPLIPFVAIAIILWGDWLAKKVHLYDLGLVALTLQ